MNFTGERYIPTVEGAEIGYEHWHRYLYAAHFAKGKSILDIACGEGYGSYLLSLTAGRTVGIDISDDAIRHAVSTYRRGNLEFSVGSVSSVPVPGSQVFDGIVSFETIEHVAEKDQEAFLGEVKRLLKPDGFFLVSTPDKLVYSDEAGYRNEFHLKEFHLDEFRTFLEKFFKHVKLLGQRVYPVSYIWDPEGNEVPLVDFELAQTERGLRPTAAPKSARYLIAWCSDLPPSSIPASIQVDVSEQMTVVRDRQIVALTEKLNEKKHLEQQVLQLEQEVRERSERIQELEKQVRERSERVQELEQQVRERSERAQEFEQQVRERSERVQELEEQLAIVVSSRSWRLTEPLRKAMAALRGLGRPREDLRSHIGAIDVEAGAFIRVDLRYQRRILRWLYHRLPISPSAKCRLREMLLSRSAHLRRLTTAGPVVVRDWPGPVGASADQAESQSQLASTQWVVSFRPAPTDRTSVLVVEHRIPTPDMTSGSTRLFAIIKMILGLGYGVTFISASDRDNYGWLLEPGTEVARYEEMIHKLGVERVLYGFSEALEHLSVDGWRYRIAFLSFPEATFQYLPMIRAHAVNAKVIFDTVDLHSLRLEREAEIKGSSRIADRAAYYRRIEVSNVLSADVVIAITPDEAARISEMVPGARVEIIPNLHEVVDDVAPMTSRHGLLFIGHYAHTPNVDAVEHFLDEVWPLVCMRLRGVTLSLIGSNMPDSMRYLRKPGVKPLGYVPDVGPHFAQARVFIAPLRYGAGMKGKIGQAMSYGLPVVTTSIGAEGMGLVAGEHALIADTPDAFADAVIQLYTDENLWNAISKNAAILLRNRFSAEALRPSVDKLLRELVAAEGPPVLFGHDTSAT